MGQEDQGVARSQGRYRAIPRTLCFITHGEDVLLLRGGPQKRLWAGLYNGVGGHVERREDIYSSVQREVREETGLAVYNLRLRVVAHIDAGDPSTGVIIFVFTATAGSRATTDSPEGALEWVPKAVLPVKEMVEDLPTLLSRVLAMQPDDPPFFAAYSYDAADHLTISFAAAI